DQWHQPGHSDKAPAFRLHALDEPLYPGPGFLADPVRRHVAGYQKRRGCPQRCAGQIEDRSPDRPKEHAAGKAEERTWNEQNGPQREQSDMGGRAPRPQTSYRVLDEDRIELTPMEREPQHTCDNGKAEYETRGNRAHCHWTDSLRPSA